MAISGSPREGGNTHILLKRCLERLATQGITGELISLAGKIIRGCTACNACIESRDATCPGITDDDYQSVFEKMVKADIIIVGSPVHFGSATPELMALLDRAGYVSRANGCGASSWTQLYLCPTAHVVHDKRLGCAWLDLLERGFGARSRCRNGGQGSPGNDRPLCRQLGLVGRQVNAALKAAVYLRHRGTSDCAGASACTGAGVCGSAEDRRPRARSCTHPNRQSMHSDAESTPCGHRNLPLILF